MCIGSILGLRGGSGAVQQTQNVSCTVLAAWRGSTERRHLVVEGVDVGQTCSVDALLKLLVTHRLNAIVSGGTSTDKTELGRLRLHLVHDNERIITVRFRQISIR